jgi:hypothetical protein
MEDVLEIYQKPFNSNIPLICMDEKPIQLLDDVHPSLPAIPSYPARYDFEYKRNGTASIFMFTEPLKGWRKANIRERRTKIDWANEIKELLESDYPDAEKIVLVCDNLNTHTLGAFYAAFKPEEAFRLLKRLEIHYTPKHGSWLNIAEIELSALTRQCLKGRRIKNIGMMKQEIKKWEHKRNDYQKSVDWQFTTADARIKLKRLYPQI